MDFLPTIENILKAQGILAKAVTVLKAGTIEASAQSALAKEIDLATDCLLPPAQEANKDVLAMLTRVMKNLEQLSVEAQGMDFVLADRVDSIATDLRQLSTELTAAPAQEAPATPATPAVTEEPKTQAAAPAAEEAQTPEAKTEPAAAAAAAAPSTDADQNAAPIVQPDGQQAATQPNAELDSNTPAEVAKTEQAATSAAVSTEAAPAPAPAPAAAAPAQEENKPKYATLDDLKAFGSELANGIMASMKELHTQVVNKQEPTVQAPTAPMPSIVATQATAPVSVAHTLQNVAGQPPMSKVNPLESFDLTQCEELREMDVYGHQIVRPTNR